MGEKDYIDSSILECRVASQDGGLYGDHNRFAFCNKGQMRCSSACNAYLIALTWYLALPSS